MSDQRVYNFSAGPSMLPLSALERAGSEITNYRGTGMSVMEMSHRSKVYDAIIKETEAALRRVLSIPQNYRVLFLQGGATTQFAAIPMNLIFVALEVPVAARLDVVLELVHKNSFQKGPAADWSAPGFSTCFTPAGGNIRKWSGPSAARRRGCSPAGQGWPL